MMMIEFLSSGLDSYYYYYYYYYECYYCCCCWSEAYAYAIIIIVIVVGLKQSSVSKHVLSAVLPSLLF